MHRRDEAWPVLIAAPMVLVMFAVGFALVIGLVWFLATHWDVLLMLVGVAAAVGFCIARAFWTLRG